MFNRTNSSVLAEIEQENPKLVSILKSVNEILRMARGKLTYMQKLLNYYDRNASIGHDRVTEYLRLNLEVLATIEELLKTENVIIASEETKKLVFSQEIKTMDEARDTLKELHHILEKENAIIKADYDWKSSQKNRQPIPYKKIAALTKFVLREVQLLGIESQKIQIISEGLGRLQERIMSYRKMPIVSAQYYYGTNFIFNVGDTVRQSLARTEGGKIVEIEKIFEEIRKQEFPNRPSRMSAVYVDTHPWTGEEYGLVYAVKVEGIVFRTDQGTFTEAGERWFFKKNKEEIKELARSYWENNPFAASPETIVNGTVTILGLADYLRKGDYVEVIVDGMKDSRGNLIPKGSIGVIRDYNKFQEEVPFYVELENKEQVSLPASTIRKVRK